MDRGFNSNRIGEGCGIPTMALLIIKRGSYRNSGTQYEDRRSDQCIGSRGKGGRNTIRIRTVSTTVPSQELYIRTEGGQKYSSQWRTFGLSKVKVENQLLIIGDASYEMTSSGSTEVCGISERSILGFSDVCIVYIS